MSSQSWQPFGAILVEQQAITAAQRDWLLRRQRVDPRPLGALARRTCGVTARQVESAWVAQYLSVNAEQALAPWLPAQDEALRWLGARRAHQFALLPLRRDAAGLTLASCRERLARAVPQAWRLGLPVQLVVAERTVLERALVHYYPSARPPSTPAAGSAMRQPEADRPTPPGNPRERLSELREDPPPTGEPAAPVSAPLTEND
jgi:hypothetical protein